MLEPILYGALGFLLAQVRFWARARYRHLCERWNAAVAVNNLHFKGYPMVPAKKRSTPYRIRQGPGRLVCYDRRESHRLLYTFKLDDDLVDRAWKKVHGEETD